MTTIKDYMFDIQYDDMSQWIREHLDDEDADEDTPGWDDLVQEWSLNHEDFREEREPIEWYATHSYSDLHRSFLFQIHNLKDLINLQVAIPHEETFYKMSYAHAVTLMESFLYDSVCTLILSNDDYFKNAICEVNELKKAKFSIKEIVSKKEGAKGFAIGVLSKLMYHNTEKVREVLRAILGSALTLDIADIEKTTLLRHDIVHRDGKTIDGKLIKVDKDIALEAIAYVEAFVENVASEISRLANA